MTIEPGRYFKSTEDEEAEKKLASIVSAHTRCEAHSFGRYSPIDWAFIRDGQMVMTLEFKNRTCRSDKYDTVFLCVRKWMTLYLADIGLGIQSLYCVGFTNEVRWIPILSVKPGRVTIKGREPRPGSLHDQEPMIEVPIKQMTVIYSFAEKP